MRFYGIIEYSDEFWVIKKCEPHVIIKLKALFPKISITGRPPIYLKDTIDICKDLFWFLSRYPLEMSNKDLNRLKIRSLMYDKRMEASEEILSNRYIPKDNIKFKGNKELRIYQNQAIELFLKNKSLLLGDDLGLGKTITSIGAIIKGQLTPAIIVLPVHLVAQWEKRIQEFSWLETHVIDKRQVYNLPQADIYIMKYSTLSGWIDAFEKLKYKSVIFDEVHYLRRDDSDRYRAAFELTKHAEYKLGLTATPIFNYGDELYNIIDCLSEGFLGSKMDFLREWMGMDKRTKDPKALGGYLREQYIFLRRTTEEVGMELPKLNKVIESVDYDQKTAESGQKLMKDLAYKVVNSANPLERGQATRDLDIKARYFTGISKAKSVAEYVRVILDNDKPCILVGWHKDVYAIWREELAMYNPVFYTGDQGKHEKERSLEKFISGESKVFILSLRSGEGIDGLQYTNCKDIVIGELDWTPAIHNQIGGRLRRDGQESVVTMHYLIAEFGSDPILVELLGIKSSEAEQIVDPLKGVKEVESDKENTMDDHRVKKLAKKILKES
jgi:SNF2 family DNA or RNA helicase